MTTLYIVLGLVGVGIAIYLLVFAGHDPEPIEEQPINGHEARVAMLQDAYDYAKEILDRDPTNEEIMLARDALAELRGL